MDAAHEKVAGPFHSTEEFDAWLTKEEEATFGPTKTWGAGRVRSIAHRQALPLSMDASPPRNSVHSVRVILHHAIRLENGQCRRTMHYVSINVLSSASRATAGQLACLLSIP
jgi:hypothetical protein